MTASYCSVKRGNKDSSFLLNTRPSFLYVQVITVSGGWSTENPKTGILVNFVQKIFITKMPAYKAGHFMYLLNMLFNPHAGLSP